jgi:hypothetical protein
MRVPIIPLPKFLPERLTITDKARSKLSTADIGSAIGRHLSGDWGDLAPEAKDENEASLREGWALHSMYLTKEGEAIYVITEADRSVTTVLLADDYC